MTSEVTQADSGMDGQSVERAELVWANLPTNRPWASLPTYEKALVCHTLARLTAQSGEGRAFDRDWCINMARKEAGYEIGAGVLAMDPDLSGEGRSGAGEDAVEMIARIIAPSAWTVYDAEKARMLRKYKGENIGWPAEQYQHKASMDTARTILAALNARQSGEGDREKFLTAYVSEDCKIIGIEHDSDADWHKVHDAHIALWNRLEERIRDREKCPRKPALRATDDAGGA